MRKLISIFTLTLLIAQTSFAAPYYRFWRGTKRPDISKEEFRNRVNRGLIPATIKYAGGKGLLGYLPFLIDYPEGLGGLGNLTLPYEIALVAYSSKEQYQKLRSTPEGKAYSDLHWEAFDRSNSSSLEPEPFTGQAQVNKAYDLLQSDADWQTGYAVVSISRLLSDPSLYLRDMQELGPDLGLISHLALVSQDLVYEYQLWSDRETYLKALPHLPALCEGMMTPIPEGTPRNLPQADALNSNLGFGQGMNAVF